jgi:hypothetical protein
MQDRTRSRSRDRKASTPSELFDKVVHSPTILLSESHIDSKRKPERKSLDSVLEKKELPNSPQIPQLPHLSLLTSSARRPATSRELDAAITFSKLEKARPRRRTLGNLDSNSTYKVPAIIEETKAYLTSHLTPIATGVAESEILRSLNAVDEKCSSPSAGHVLCGLAVIPEATSPVASAASPSRIANMGGNVLIPGSPILRDSATLGVAPTLLPSLSPARLNMMRTLWYKVIGVSIAHLAFKSIANDSDAITAYKNALRFNSLIPKARPALRKFLLIWRRRRAAVVVESFLTAIESGKLSESKPETGMEYMKKFLSSVRAAQLQMRRFLECKKARVAVLCRVWDRMENEYIRSLIAASATAGKRGRGLVDSAAAASAAADAILANGGVANQVAGSRTRKRRASTGSNPGELTYSRPASAGITNANAAVAAEVPCFPPSKRDISNELRWVQVEMKFTTYLISRGEKTRGSVERELLNNFKLPVDVKTKFISSMIEKARRRSIFEDREFLMKRLQSLKNKKLYSVDDAKALVRGSDHANDRVSDRMSGRGSCRLGGGSGGMRSIKCAKDGDEKVEENMEAGEDDKDSVLLERMRVHLKLMNMPDSMALSALHYFATSHVASSEAKELAEVLGLTTANGRLACGLRKRQFLFYKDMAVHRETMNAYIKEQHKERKTFLAQEDLVTKVKQFNEYRAMLLASAKAPIRV